MTIIRIAGFAGANLAVQEMLLPDMVGTVSLNQKPGRNDLRPWNAPAVISPAPTLAGSAATIYRMGRAAPSDANYWLSWPTVVHAVLGPNADDTLERTYYTGDGAPKWTDTSKALTASPYPAAYRALGVTPPTNAPTLSATGGVSANSESRFYAYTYVTDAGEESAPSPVSAVITCKTDDVVTVATTASSVSEVTIKRIYRTQANAAGTADFFLVNVRDLTAATTGFDSSDANTSSEDRNLDLGEALPSTTWLKPEAGMKWLTGLWNGMMAGIVGRAVRFCEANTYYAWPVAYEVLPTNAQPVALATFGQTLVMLTDGAPSIITGGTPDAMDERPLEFLQACVAPLSAVGMGHGVAWASPDGLCYVGGEGARILTQGVMTRDDWQALKPSTIKGCMHEGRYIGFYNDGTSNPGARKGFMLDLSNVQGMYFMDFGVDALYLDAQQDSLYVLDGAAVKKWDAGSALTVTFKSKVFRQLRPMPGFACAEVVASSYPVTFRLYADGVLKHTQTVASRAPFRLPGGYHALDYQVEVAGAVAVQGIAMAHSMQELATT